MNWRTFVPTIEAAKAKAVLYYRDPFTVAIVTFDSKNLTPKERKELGITGKVLTGVGITKRMRYAKKYDKPDTDRAKEIAVNRAYKDIFSQAGLL